LWEIGNRKVNKERKTIARIRENISFLGEREKKPREELGRENLSILL